ncbi:MAG: CRISPR-associated endonuclease Cas2 [Pseudomonadales bacterium]|jgi:CRISPR-associated protein Cas2|nr:CRISPR-associated endonuclease Cas2 [Pseudomonadales bacterium]MCP5338384.1 CRISPR-associated endonuclease Cas2 [Pseudomonadales bacterium]
MSESPMLLCYDIRNPRRLVRVYRRARRFGLALQYSVFYLELSESRLNDLLDQIHSVIDETEDDVRVYRISGLQAVQQIGRSIFPDGVLVTGSRGGAMGMGQGK